MAVRRPLALLCGCLLCLVETAHASSLGEFFIGQSFEAAREALRKYGEVRPITSGSTTIGYMAGDFMLDDCEGYVWGISRSLSPTFSNFVNSAETTEAQLSQKPSVTIINDNGTSPTYGIVLEWALPDGTTQNIIYSESGEGHAVSVSAGIHRTRLCKQRP